VQKLRVCVCIVNQLKQHIQVCLL